MLIDGILLTVPILTLGDKTDHSKAASENELQSIFQLHHLITDKGPMKKNEVDLPETLGGRDLLKDNKQILVH